MNNIQSSTKTLVIIGNNFIAQSLYEDYKRYGKIKINLTNSISSVNYKVDYIIDSTFNERMQKLTITHCKKNNVDKLLIINHWEKKNIPKIKTTILQAVIYDVYGINHNSFTRQGAGNNDETDINYCTLISESIRRIHESKIGGIPITYIPYGEKTIKLMSIENLYQPINYMISTLNKDSTYCIYDEEKHVGSIINIVKDIIDYKGEVIFHNTNSIYSHDVKNLDFNFKKYKFENNIRRIYRYLLENNPRFDVINNF